MLLKSWCSMLLTISETKPWSISRLSLFHLYTERSWTLCKVQLTSEYQDCSADWSLSSGTQLQSSVKTTTVCSWALSTQKWVVAWLASRLWLDCNSYWCWSDITRSSGSSAQGHTCDEDTLSTSLSLSILKREAYTKYVGDCQENLPSNRHKKQSTKDDLHLLGNADHLFEVTSHHLYQNMAIWEAAKSQIWCHAWKQTHPQTSMRLMWNSPVWCIFWNPTQASKHSATMLKRWFHSLRSTWPLLNVLMSSGISDSLKATTRESRGAGVRQRLPNDGNGKLPEKLSAKWSQ